MLEDRQEAGASEANKEVRNVTIKIRNFAQVRFVSPIGVVFDVQPSILIAITSNSLRKTWMN